MGELCCCLLLELLFSEVDHMVREQFSSLLNAEYTGAREIARRHTPGTFTNQLHTSYNEPRPPSYSN